MGKHLQVRKQMKWGFLAVLGMKKVVSSVGTSFWQCCLRPEVGQSIWSKPRQDSTNPSVCLTNEPQNMRNSCLLATRRWDDCLTEDQCIIPSYLDGATTPQATYYCFGAAVWFGVIAPDWPKTFHMIESASDKKLLWAYIVCEFGTLLHVIHLILSLFVLLNDFCYDLLH